MGGICSGGDAPNPHTHSNTPRTRAPQSNPTTATPNKSVQIAAPGRPGQDPNADLASKLGTTAQDQQDVEDLIKEHLADAPDQEYLKHILDETSENFIDVRAHSSHHSIEEHEASERRSDYHQHLSLPVSHKLSLNTLPHHSDENSEALFNIPVPHPEWLHHSSHHATQAVHSVVVKPISSEIVVSFNALIDKN